MDHPLLDGPVGTDSIAHKPGAKAGDVKSRVEKALKCNAEVGARNIKVSVIDDGKVAVTGKVRNWQEREAVTNAAWSVNGIVSVEDRLSFN